MSLSKVQKMEGAGPRGPAKSTPAAGSIFLYNEGFYSVMNCNKDNLYDIINQ
jgi:hypothetical protein